jgi:hypothetical protein
MQLTPGHRVFIVFPDYTDLLFDDLSTYNHCLAAIKPLVSELIILGEYENGRKED